MTINEEEELNSWWSHLEKDPADWDYRLIFADRLEELGEDTLARGQRWQVQERKLPIRTSSARSTMAKSWDWWGFTWISPTVLPGNPVIGPSLYALLLSEGKKDNNQQVKRGVSHSYVEFDSMREAEEALAKALTQKEKEQHDTRGVAPAAG